MEDIILLGIGGNTRSVVDSIEQEGQYRIIGFFDREEMQRSAYRDYPVLDADVEDDCMVKNDKMVKALGGGKITLSTRCAA